MEDTSPTTVFQDWELLQSPVAIDGFDADEPKTPASTDGGSDDGAIKFDYFSLDSDKRPPISRPVEEDSEEGGFVSDNPSWVEPGSESRYGDDIPRDQMGFAPIVFPHEKSGEFWSDASSDGRSSLPDSEKSELADAGDSVMEVGLEGGGETGHVNCGGDVDSGELVGMRDERDGSDSSAGDGEKKGMVWWKMPFELLKFCVLRVRPLWSISMAAAFIGAVLLGRRLYKMKHKTRSIPLRVIFDDKKASQFMIRAARLNEAFSVVRRVPIIRPGLPTGGVSPFPAVSLR